MSNIEPFGITKDDIEDVLNKIVHGKFFVKPVYDGWAISIQSSQRPINNVAGQFPNRVTLSLSKDGLAPQVYGGMGGSRIFLKPDKDDPAQKHLAMYGLKIPFRSPPKDKVAILKAIGVFATRWKTAIKDNEDRLYHKESTIDTKRKSILMSGYETDGSALATEDAYGDRIADVTKRIDKLLKSKLVIRHPNDLYQVPEKVWKASKLTVHDTIGIHKYDIQDWSKISGNWSRDIAIRDEEKRLASRQTKVEYFEPFVNPINRDAHTFILNKIIANPLWKQMERYYRLINAIVKTCPEHIRTDHCDRDQIVSHLKRLKLKGKNEMKNETNIIDQVLKLTKSPLLKRYLPNCEFNVHERLNKSVQLEIEYDDGYKISVLFDSNSFVILKKRHQFKNLNEAIAGFINYIAKDKDFVGRSISAADVRNRNNEAVVHNTYLVDKRLKPVDIAVEYGVTMSIIGREGNKSITKVEGDEADIAQFVKDFDAEEFDIADAASPAGVDEAVEDAFKASTSVETARMAMVKRIAKDAPVSTYRSKVGKIIIYTWKNKRWNMMQFMANKSKPYSAISYQSETDLAYALKYALSHAASTPINKPNAKGHGIKVGDIFVDSWGATMQLNHFYKIVDLPSPVMAVVQKLRGDRTETGRFGGAGTEVPTDKHDGSPKKVKLAKDTNGNITFKTDVNSRAHPWNGKPMAYDTND